MSAVPLTEACCIRALLPDDGTDLRLLKALLREHGITRADSVHVRSVGMLHAARSKRGLLPEAEMAKLLIVVVDAATADALFDYICEKGNINRPGGGLVTMQRLGGATAFTLLGGVAIGSE